MPFRYCEFPVTPQLRFPAFPSPARTSPTWSQLLASLLGLNSKGSRRPAPQRPAGSDSLSPWPPGLQWRVRRSGARWEVPSPPVRSNGSPPRGPLAPEPLSRPPGPTSARNAGAGAGRSVPAPAHLGGVRGHAHPGRAPAAGRPRPARPAPAPHSPGRTASAASPGAGRRHLCRSPPRLRDAGDSTPLLLPPPPLLHPQLVRLLLLLPPRSPPPPGPPLRRSVAAPAPARRPRQSPGPRPAPPRPARAGLTPPGPAGRAARASPWARSSRPSLRAWAGSAGPGAAGGGRWGTGTPPRRPPRAPGAGALYLWQEGRASRPVRPCCPRCTAPVPKSGPGRGSGGELRSGQLPASRSRGTRLAALPAWSAHPRRDTDAHSPDTRSRSLSAGVETAVRFAPELK